MGFEVVFGEIIFNDFELDVNLPLNSQLDKLKEKLLEIKYKNYTVEVGWFPAFDINGTFKVVVVKDFNWEKPCFYKESKNIDKLYRDVNELMKFFKHL